MEEYPDDQRYKVGHDLVIGKAAGKQTNADVSRAYQEQAEIAAENAAMVHWPQGGNSNVIGEGKPERDQDKQEGSSKFSGDDLPVGDWTGQK